MLTAIQSGSRVRATKTVIAVTKSGVRRVYPMGTVFEVSGYVPGGSGVVCKCPRLGVLVRVPAGEVEAVIPMDAGADSEGGEAD